MSHIHLAGGQEVLHGHGTARIAALVELALHELARRDDLVDLVVAVMVFQELRLQERESAFGFGTLHASLLHSMDETSIKAVVAHLAVAVHHGVCRAQQNVVMCGVHHWHTMLLQVRRIQNRQCQLTVHVVHVDHIRLELLQQRLKLALGFQRIDQRCRFLCLLECGNFTDVVFFRYEILAPIAWLVVRVLHGEEGNFVA